MWCKGSTDTPKGATFRTGTTSKLKNGGSAKSSLTVREKEEKESKSRISVALARRVCQNSNILDEAFLSLFIKVTNIPLSGNPSASIISKFISSRVLNAWYRFLTNK